MTSAPESPHEPHDHDLGLGHDLARMTGRRGALAMIGGAGAALLVAACSSDGGTAQDTTTSTTTAGSGTASSDGSSASSDGSSCEVIPEETAGPYPGDGSNGPDVLSESGVVRSDITTSFGSMSGTAEGTPLDIELVVLDTANGCAPYEGAAVYVWHCDRAGDYSLYSDGVTDQNFLRGVQVADADGRVRFSSVFPGCYPGRWPHIHFEVYPNVDAATSASSKLATSQVALPEDISAEVYADAEGYSASVSNLAGVSLESDNVFRDGWSRELATMSGSVGNGLTSSLTVPV